MPTPSAPPPIVVDAVGARIGIDTASLDAGDHRLVAAAWRDAQAPSTTAPDAVVVPRGARGTEQMLASLSMDVTRAAIAARRGAAWLLHAAGVAAPDGRVVVFVGRSGAGKTTATRALGQRWGYVSDETVSIDAEGAVLPYRKPLSVITDGHDVKVQHAPADLGLRPLPDAPLRVARVVLLDRHTDGGPARLEPETLSGALPDLAVNSSALAAMADPLRTLARVIARTGGVLRARYADARDLVPLVEELLAAPPLASDIDDPTIPLRSAPDTAQTPPSTIERAPFVDTCALEDGRIAVLSARDFGDAELRVLDGIGPSIWQEAAGTTREQLIAAVERRHGAPPPGVAVDALIDEAIEALHREGLLVPARR